MTDRADRARAEIHASLDAITDTLADLIRRLNEAADEQSSLSPVWYPSRLKQDPHYRLAAPLREAAKALR